MRPYTLFLSVALLASPLFAAKKQVQEFPYPVAKVWTAAIQAASEEYAVLSSDREDHVLTFETSPATLSKEGMRFGVSVQETSSGAEVILHPVAHGRDQLGPYDWGFGSHVAKKYFKAISDSLTK